MIIRLLPTYIYLFMDAQNALPFHSKVKDETYINNFTLDLTKTIVLLNLGSCSLWNLLCTSNHFICTIIQMDEVLDS